ncbi:uncharacterized protein [Diabrotica undecimpunctata]|uniref:uncharacterized protein n=1 Tax=Diabrotica undecimpunctata TaxID=50387 RepID=UPI003B641339
MSSYSTALRKTIKWFRKIAVEALTGTAVVNAWILHNSVRDSRMSITTFRENLCLQLLGVDNISATTDNNRLEKHELKATEKRKRCKICYTRLAGQHNRTYAAADSKQVIYYICPACPDKPPICIDCFFNSHVCKPK